MMKRPGEETSGHSHQQKKQKNNGHPHHNHQQSNHHSSQQHRNFNKKNDHKKEESQKPRQSYEEALAQFPPPTSKPGAVSPFTPFTVAPGLPALPPIKDEKLSTAPFNHRSTINYNRATQSKPDITYEKLEFLGDAYIELIATRLIFSRFAHLPAGQQSQLRELLVKNETLAEYSRAYGFENKVNVLDIVVKHEKSAEKGNKGFNKVLGDVFEAYIAAVILSDEEEGYAVAEKWLTTLWAPKLLEASKHDRSYIPPTHSSNSDPAKIYNPTAKADLQQRIHGNGVKLDYEPYKAMVELKGDQLGQNRHFIALYLTGYGYERKLLGKGEGKNKVEAGNWAANEAMFGEAKGVVEECERQLNVVKEEARRAREERMRREPGSEMGQV